MSGYEGLADRLELIDANDRHVVAAAIRANAQAIVTFNLRHFPDHALAPFDLEAKHPDEFVLDSIDLAPGLLVKCLTELALSLERPPMSIDAVLDSLQGRLGMVRSVARFRDLMGR